MAAVYDLSSMIAQAQQPGPPAPAPVSTAPVSVFTPPARVPSYAVPGIGQVNPAPPPPNPNDSPFAQMMAPYKTNSTPGPGGTIAPSALERTKTFFGGTQADVDALNARAGAAAVLNHPEVANMAAQNPKLAAMIQADPLASATKLQPLIEAMTGAHPTTVTNGGGTKPVNDPANLTALTKITGDKHEDLHPFVEPHHYSDEEFLNATQGLNWKQAARMFGAVQRLNPQQQITNQYAGILHDNAAQAEAAYQAAAAKNVPKATLDKLDAERTASNNAARAFLKKISEGSNVAFPDSAVQ